MLSDTGLMREQPSNLQSSVVRFIALNFLQKRSAVKVKTGVDPQSLQRPQHLSEDWAFLDAAGQKVAAGHRKHRRFIALRHFQQA